MNVFYLYGRYVLILKILKASTNRNNGFNSSPQLAGEIIRVFNKKISASFIKKFRFANGKKNENEIISNTNL